MDLARYQRLEAQTRSRRKPSKTRALSSGRTRNREARRGRRRRGHLISTIAVAMLRSPAWPVRFRSVPAITCRRRAAPGGPAQAAGRRRSPRQPARPSSGRRHAVGRGPAYAADLCQLQRARERTRHDPRGPGRGALSRLLLQASELLAAGKLTLINNQVATTTGTIMLEATFPQPARAAVAGAFVAAHLVEYIRHNALTVPAAAVMTGPNGPYVYVMGRRTRPRVPASRWRRPKRTSPSSPRACKQASASSPAGSTGSTTGSGRVQAPKAAAVERPAMRSRNLLFAGRSRPRS